MVDDDEPTSHKKPKEALDDEFVLISALTGTVTHGSDTWFICSGAS